MVYGVAAVFSGLVCVVTLGVFGCSAQLDVALHSADSMAWSFAARRQGRNANDWREAMRWINPGELFA